MKKKGGEALMKAILVSACLLGCPCRYDGKSVPRFSEAFFTENGLCAIPVCPEVSGGLPTPRPTAEIKEGRVFNTEGRDTTDAFEGGARLALETARNADCICALLKERSPSCGKGHIYDGSFTGRLTEGDGITAALLLRSGIPVFGESEADALLLFAKK